MSAPAARANQLGSSRVFPSSDRTKKTGFILYALAPVSAAQPLCASNRAFPLGVLSGIFAKLSESSPCLSSTPVFRSRTATSHRSPERDNEAGRDRFGES